MLREFKYDFFVLYDTNDNESEIVAEEFVNDAESRFQGKKGCSPDRDFPIGGYKHDHVQNAVRDSAVTFLFLPRHSNEQLHFDGLNAVTRLLEENNPENRNRIAPIQLRDEVVLPTFLHAIKCIKWDPGNPNFWNRVGHTLAHQAEACEEPNTTAPNTTVPEAGDAPAGNLDDAILDVVENISPGDCKFLARKLKVPDGDIEEVEYNHRGNAREIKYQLLMTWKKRQSKETSLDDLIKGLKGIKNMQLAHNLERKYIAYHPQHRKKEPQQTTVQAAPAKKNQKIPAPSVTVPDRSRVNGQPEPLNATQVDPIIENPPSPGQVNNTVQESTDGNIADHSLIDATQPESARPIPHLRDQDTTNDGITSTTSLLSNGENEQPTSSNTDHSLIDATQPESARPIPHNRGTDQDTTNDGITSTTSLLSNGENEQPTSSNTGGVSTQEQTSMRNQQDPSHPRQGTPDVIRQSSTTEVLRTALQTEGSYYLKFCIISAVISFVGALVAICVFRAGYGCPLQNQGQLVGLGILTAIYMLLGVCMFISLLYWGFHYGHVAEIIAHNSAVALLAGVITILWGSVIFGVFMATITGDCFKVQETFQSTLAPLTLPSSGLNQTSNLVSDILT